MGASPPSYDTHKININSRLSKISCLLLPNLLLLTAERILYMNDRLKTMYTTLSSLSVFRGILADETIIKLLDMLRELTPQSVGAFTSSLYKTTDNLTDYIFGAVSEDENPFMLRLAALEEVPEEIEKAAKSELAVLGEIARLSADEVRAALGENARFMFSGWKTSGMDFSAQYAKKMNFLSTKGYGIFAKYSSFSLKNGQLAPIKTPDPQRLSQLSGYELERGKVITNTLALLCGKPAANVLLYGDAGTGKSSTVKAVLNEYASQGLRLIEIGKPQLSELPDIMERISKSPLKFIIFVDDISFSADDDNFSSLKAMLEGSASAKTPNAVIYATSNRRHIVKESYSDRSGDDMHASDTREELMSLSERFGLKIAFLKPDKEKYLEIVKSLAKSGGIEVTDELLAGAEAFALRRNGRSGRAAKHYIESVLSR